MNKTRILIIAFLASFAMNAQSYIGFLTDNYSGVNSVISNPANIADSRFKVDINLAGASILAGNDYYGLDLTEAFKDDFDFDDETTRSPSDDNVLFGNVDILGPSFSINLTDKSAIAVFTRARAFVNVNNLNGGNIQTLEDGFDESQDFSISEDEAYFTSNIWSEIGVSYARVLLDKEKHFLKGGVSLKYIAGLGSAYASTDDLNFDFDADGLVIQNNTFGSIESNGNLTYGTSDNFQDEIDLDDVEIVTSGFGVDLGFVYEWRPNIEEHTYTDADGNKSYFKDVNKYKLKLGISVTDIGSLDYDANDGIEENFDINNVNVSQENFEDIEDFDDFETTLGLVSTISEIESTSLPTALHVNADWNINQKFYLNLNTDLSLVDQEKLNQNSIVNIVTLTPRYERKWFTFQTPLSIQQYTGFQAGAGFRAGPIYVGSGSIITALLDDEAEAADVYLGLKIPIYQSRPKTKDRDGDGVIDKLDDCPKEAGPAENNGCPWGDADGDGVLDNVDKCPNEVGPKENDGCPIIDTDGDGVIDTVDECVNVVGPAENSGCPWTDADGDGILDKDDKCINEPGVKENGGCPVKVVSEVVLKKLNNYAKTILFDSGKSSLKAQSNVVLSDIATILKEYPLSKFRIEGHTDSSGNNNANKVLSDNRANTVKTFLINNGISESRLSSVGYGEEQPITSNATREGRALNRRVEITLVK